MGPDCVGGVFFGLDHVRHSTSAPPPQPCFHASEFRVRLRVWDHTGRDALLLGDSARQWYCNTIGYSPLSSLALLRSPSVTSRRAPHMHAFSRPQGRPIVGEATCTEVSATAG